MDKYSVDYNSLDNEVTRPKVYRYDEVKDKLIKVAFDIVRFREPSDIDGLWQIQSVDDGEVIVARYEEDPKSELKSTASEWAVVTNRAKTHVNVFYRNESIAKFAASELPVTDVDFLTEKLPESLTKNEGLRKALLNSLSSAEKQELLKKFPELC